MAWIYSQESADSQSPSSPGSAPLPIVNETPTLKLCSCREWLLVNSTVRRYGTTLHRSEAPCFQESTSSSEDSHAKTSALQDVVQAWVASEADFTGKCTDSSENADLVSSFSKMFRRSAPVELVKWPSHLPISGMIKDGMLYPLKKLAPPSSDDVGFFLPRPTAKHYGSNKGGGQGRVGKPRHSIWQLATLGLLPGHPKGVLNREYLEMVMGFPSQWTEIDASVMQWFLSKRKRRSKSSRESGVEL